MKNIIKISLAMFFLACFLTSGHGISVNLPAIPGRIVNLTNFGAVGDGKTLNTEAFAKAIASLSQKGGGKLEVPPGIWLTGPIRLHSKINLHLERGAL